MEMKRVSLDVTPGDETVIRRLMEELQSTSQVSAVRQALRIADWLVTKVRDPKNTLIIERDGRQERYAFPEIPPLKQHSETTGPFKV